MSASTLAPAPNPSRRQRVWRLARSLVSVWWQPRSAVRAALELAPPAGLITAVWTLGLIGANLPKRDWSAGAGFPLPAGWSPIGAGVLALLAAAGLTVASLVLGAAVLRLIGRLLGGRATSTDLRVALAWGFLPHAWALLYRLPGLVLWPGLAGRDDAVRVEFEHGLVQIDWSALEGVWLPGLVAVGFTDAVVQVAGLVVLAKALGEANGFSAWRGLGSWLIAIVAAVAVLIAVVIAGVRLLAPHLAG